MGLAASRQEAFWEACGFGHIERAKHFLKEGDIDVNWVSYTNDCCPIHVASQGKPEIVELLLQHNCDVNVKDIRGNLALHHAAIKGHADIVQTLIKAGSEINVQEKNGWTPLHNAAYWCHPDVIKVLIDNGCDVNIQNKDERTALHECARSRETDERKLGDIATMLIKAGSDVNAKSSDLGEADLTGLMYAAYHNHPNVASALIEKGCELDAVGSTFWTALHWATDRENDELIYILLEAGANPIKKGMRGETALDRAQSDDIREALTTAMDLYRELHRINLRESKPIIHAPKPVTKFVPREDNFKSESFLPKDWKPSSNVKNLINEKKSRLAAATSQQYRNELARRTGGSVIETSRSKSEEPSVGEGDIKVTTDRTVQDGDNAIVKDKDCPAEDGESDGIVNKTLATDDSCQREANIISDIDEHGTVIDATVDMDNEQLCEEGSQSSESEVDKVPNEYVNCNANVDDDFESCGNIPNDDISTDGQHDGTATKSVSDIGNTSLTDATPAELSDVPTEHPVVDNKDQVVTTEHPVVDNKDQVVTTEHPVVDNKDQVPVDTDFTSEKIAEVEQEN